MLFSKTSKAATHSQNSLIFSFATDIWNALALTPHELNLISFGIQTTFWSRKWLQVSFFKNIKKWQHFTEILSFNFAPDVWCFPIWCSLALKQIYSLGRVSKYYFSKILKSGNTVQLYLYKYWWFPGFDSFKYNISHWCMAHFLTYFAILFAYFFFLNL